MPHASLSENLRYQGKVSQNRLEAITSRLEASASRWEVFATDWRPSPWLVSCETKHSSKTLKVGGHH